MVSGTHRPSYIHISTQAIVNNYLKIKGQLPKGTQVHAVIKANAYGHGALPVAKALCEADVDGFCVAISDEALELRANDISRPILILGVTPVEDAPLLAQKQVSVTVSSLHYLKEAYNRLGDSPTHPLNVHLKVDTGMGRIGLRHAEDLQPLVNFIASHPSAFKLEGIFTHFATADNLSNWETDVFESQAHRFQNIVTALDFSQLPNQPVCHYSNSAMCLWHPEMTLDWARLGIAMYGLNTTNDAMALPYDLEPALSLTSTIIYVKKLSAHETISYGATYTTSQEEWIATLPIGYADGCPRQLTGYTVLVDGHECPIVGRVCMDQLMIRLPADIPVGTTVTLIGTDGDNTISLQDVASYIGTIHYEVACLLSERLPREYE